MKKMSSLKTRLEFANRAISYSMGILPSRISYSNDARVLLLAIGLQESKLHHRVQVLDGGGKGSARGLWQFERGGGVAGVIRHRSTQAAAVSALARRGCQQSIDAAWKALEFDDVLAAAFARLLLYTDPRPLPAIGEVDEAWQYYLRNWRPGKPHPKAWAGHYGSAMEFVTGQKAPIPATTHGGT